MDSKAWDNIHIFFMKCKYPQKLNNRSHPPSHGKKGKVSKTSQETWEGKKKVGGGEMAELHYSGFSMEVYYILCAFL